VVAFAADEAAAQRIIEVWRDTAVVDRIIRAKSPEHPNISVRQ
jgi:4-diphosphocytidyl-2-C-methyl-D-erythritol kinase